MQHHSDGAKPLIPLATHMSQGITMFIHIAQLEV